MGAPAGTTSSLIPPSPPANLVTTLVDNNPSNLGTPEDAADNHGNGLTLISTLGGVAPLQVTTQQQHLECKQQFINREMYILRFPAFAKDLKT